VSRFWRAPVLWQNDTVFIIGGGPSLKTPRPQRSQCARPDQRVIAVNNAFRLVDQPDVIFYADTRWWGWNKADIASNFPAGSSPPARRRSPTSIPASAAWGATTATTADTCAPGEVVSLTDDPTLLSGPDSGSMAMNLAYHFGASRIVLLGFDMGFVEGESHWHPDHQVPSVESQLHRSLRTALPWSGRRAPEARRRCDPLHAVAARLHPRGRFRRSLGLAAASTR
jgi:hypothetical protein